MFQNDLHHFWKLYFSCCITSEKQFRFHSMFTYNHFHRFLTYTFHQITTKIDRMYTKTVSTKADRRIIRSDKIFVQASNKKINYFQSRSPIYETSHVTLFRWKKLSKAIHKNAFYLNSVERNSSLKGTLSW